jgi:hypothetical protein
MIANVLASLAMREIRTTRRDGLRDYSCTFVVGNIGAIAAHARAPGVDVSGRFGWRRGPDADGVRVVERPGNGQMRTSAR